VKNVVKHENEVILGDCRVLIPDLDDGSINSCITSPPYWGCRNYDADGQIGLEQSPLEYIDELFKIFSILKPKLRADGSLFIVIDDVWASNWTRGRDHTWISPKSKHEGVTSEAFRGECAIDRNWTEKLGIAWIKAKQKLLLPERLAIRMQEEDGWFLREDLTWHKVNAGNYTNIRDRFAHASEHVLHFTRSQKYYADMEAIRDGKGKLCHDVLDIPIERSPTEHSAVFPKKLVEKLIGFSCPVDGIVLDPFCGTGTTLVVAKAMDRRYIGIELSEAYYNITMQALGESGVRMTSRCSEL
jgi:DNA modification methylase